MPCPDDFTLSQYADGELPEDATRQLVTHFKVCTVCQKRAEAFETENLLLAESLQGIEWWQPEQETIHRKIPGIAWIGSSAAALIGIAFILRAGLGLIQNTTLPAGLNWLHPFSLAGQLNLAANGFFYFLEKGRDIMTTLINEVGAAVLVLMMLGLLITMIRRTRLITATVSFMLVVLVSVVPGKAIEIRKANPEEGFSNITVSTDEIIDDTLVVFADSIDIRGIVTGDLISFARRINVPGAVHGNVITMGQTVDITGKVDGDIIGFGQTFRANGEVGKNIWAFAQNLAIDTESNLEQNATVFGTHVNVDGYVGKDLTAFAAFLDVGGNIGRDLNLAAERLSVKGSSVIGRNLTAHVRSEDNIQIHPDATIMGDRNIAQKEQQVQPNKYLTVGFYFKQALRIAGAFLMGLLLFWLIPGMKHPTLSTGREFLFSGGIGFLAAVAIPFAIILLAITLIGLPIAFTALLFWLLALYLAKIVVGKHIGSVLMRTNNNTFGATALSLIIGLLIVIVAVNLPFIGGILNILLTIIGMGAVFFTGYRLFKKPHETEPNPETAI